MSGCWGWGGNNHDKDIRDLSIQDLFGSTDIIPVYSGTNRDDRGVTGQALLNYINANLVNPSIPFTQYYTPGGTGFSIAIAPLNAGQSVRLLLTPTGTLATGTIVIPGGGLPALPVDKQEVLVTSTQTVTALTVSAGTTPVVSPPTTVTALTPFRMWYDATNAAWYMSA